MTAIQRGLKASGGDTAGPCISKYCSSLDPTGTIFQSPLVLLFVSFLLISPVSRTSPLSAATQRKPARCVQTSKDSITFINEHSKRFCLNFGVPINQNCSAHLPLKRNYLNTGTVYRCQYFLSCRLCEYIRAQKFSRAQRKCFRVLL